MTLPSSSVASAGISGGTIPMPILMGATWMLAGLASLAVVKLTSIGPVVLTISKEWGMGVHVGDSLVLIPLSAAGLLTAHLLRK